MAYTGIERRKYPRFPGKLVVSYRVKDKVGDVHVSQTRNIGLGGMLLTTNKSFPLGTVLAIDIRLPFFVSSTSKHNPLSSRTSTRL